VTEPKKIVVEFWTDKLAAIAAGRATWGATAVELSDADVAGLTAGQRAILAAYANTGSMPHHLPGPADREATGADLPAALDAWQAERDRLDAEKAERAAARQAERERDVMAYLACSETIGRHQIVAGHLRRWIDVPRIEHPLPASAGTAAKERDRDLRDRRAAIVREAQDALGRELAEIRAADERERQTYVARLSQATRERIEAGYACECEINRLIAELIAQDAGHGVALPPGATFDTDDLTLTDAQWRQAKIAPDGWRPVRATWLVEATADDDPEDIDQDGDVVHETIGMGLSLRRAGIDVRLFAPFDGNGQ